MTELTHDEIQRLKTENAELREQLEQATTRAEAAEDNFQTANTLWHQVEKELADYRKFPLEPLDEYKSLDHAMEVLRTCAHSYTGQQAQAVAKVFKLWQEKWAMAVDIIGTQKIDYQELAELRAYRTKIESSLADLCHYMRTADYVTVSADVTDMEARGLWRTLSPAAPVEREGGE